MGLLHSRYRMLLALLLGLALVAGACGDDDASGGMADMNHDGEMSDVDMADEGHSHEETAMTPWEGAAPSLELSFADGEHGKIVVLSADGFTFTDAATLDNVAGEGHSHVFVDGRLLTMGFEPEVLIGHLEPGMHHIEVTLSANDHSDYMLDGEVVGVSTMVEIEGEVAAADLILEIGYSGGEVTGDRNPGVSTGSVVEIVVTSDVAERVHVHGYDIFGDLTPGIPTTMRFVADIPGIFEIELEDSGTLLFNLEVS